MTDLAEQVQAIVSDAVSNEVAANLGDVASTALDNTDLSALEGLTDGIQQAVEGALTEGVVGNTDGAVGDLIAEAIGGEPLPPAQVFL